MSTVSPNVGLRIPAGLDEDSRFNLLRLDALLASGLYDSSSNLTLRSIGSILFRPSSGNGGTVGCAHQLADFNINSLKLTLNDSITFEGSWKIPKVNLDLSTLVASDITDFDSAVGFATSVAANTSHRNDSSLHFTENSIQHQNISGAGTNTHTQIDAHIASISNPHNVTPSQIGAYTTAQVDTLLNSKSNLAHTHTSSAITDFTSAVNANSNVSTAFTHSSVTGNPHGTTAAQVGADTSSQVDSKISNHNALTGAHGVLTVAGLTEAQAFTNKTINGSLNTITNLTNASIANLAAIAGTKIFPDFGTQNIRTSGILELENGGYVTGIRAAQSGQTADVTWDLPPEDGLGGQVIATNGSGELTWVSVLSSSLFENYVDIGAAGDVRAQVDTTTLGHIAANTASGLTIKSDVITNAMVNASAGIAYSKLAALTLNRVLVSNGSGFVSPSSVTTTEIGYVSGVSSSIQTQLDSKQAGDGDLTALAALASTGIVTRIAADTYATRTISAASTKLSVVNGDGVGGNPTLDLGAVSTDDLSEGTALFYTDERAQDAVGSILNDTSSVGFTYDDAGNQISAVVLPAGVDHDSLNNFVANEHINHTSVSITGSDGISGGGDISANRSLSLDINGLALVTPADADTIPVYDSSNTANRKISVSDLKALGKFKVDWITADGATKVVNHGLSSSDVMVEVYDKANGETIYVDIFRTDADNVTVQASEAPGAGSWRVLIMEC